MADKGVLLHTRTADEGVPWWDAIPDSCACTAEAGRGTHERLNLLMIAPPTKGVHGRIRV